MRTAAAQFDDIPGQLPEAKVPDDADYASIGQATIEKLNNLQDHDLAPFAIWRDLLSLTDTFRTFQSAETVFKNFTHLRAEKHCSDFRLHNESEPRRTDAPDPPTSWLNYDVSFTVNDGGLIGVGAGTVSVMLTSSGDWKIWMLCTWLENYENHGHPDQTDAKSDSEIAKSDDTQVYEAAIIGGKLHLSKCSVSVQCADIDFSITRWPRRSWCGGSPQCTGSPQYHVRGTALDW